MKKTHAKTQVKHMMQPFVYKNHTHKNTQTMAYITYMEVLGEVVRIAIVDMGDYFRAFEYRTGFNVSPNQPKAKSIRLCFELAAKNCRVQVYNQQKTMEQLAQHLPTLNHYA